MLWEIEDILVKDKKEKQRYVMEVVPVRQSVLWDENETNSFNEVPVMPLEEFAAIFYQVCRSVFLLSYLF